MVLDYPPLNKTFAELTTDQKNKISHRAIALKKMRDYIQNNINNFI
jgi:XTP/dITP diphosphohydrolase